MRKEMLATVILAGALLCGCGGGPASAGNTPAAPATTPTAAPSISIVEAQNGAVVVGLESSTPGATIYYTTDGSTPGTGSLQYFAPFLVASNVTLKALAVSNGNTSSSVTSQSFTPNVPAKTLVWSEEFSNSTGANAAPNPKVWTYDTGNSGFGNQELEYYCAWGSTTSPCDPTNPTAYVDTNGILHIAARQPSAGVYTSARLKTQGLFSFQYGRVEARMKLPEAQGMWPAFWALGNNITTVDWPACGEIDVMEHIDGSNPKNEGYDWVQGSLHGVAYNTGTQYHPVGFSATDWHTYGVIWTKAQIQFYIDDPSNVYATNTPGSVTGGTWPFDSGPQFLLLNLAVGGNWPGSPDSTTVFPSEVQVDYVRIYTN